jgi:hypothetical protein
MMNLDPNAEVSSLNPLAMPFVPTSFTPGVRSPPTHPTADPVVGFLQPLGADPNDVTNGFAMDTLLPESLAYYCDREDALRDGLYTPPQQPKGNTYGRARARR